jgi:hypothetical protein
MLLFFTNGYLSLKFENFTVLNKNIHSHTYSILVKQSLVSIILYNGFSNNATDINDFLCKILVVVVFLKSYFL